MLAKWFRGAYCDRYSRPLQDGVCLVIVRGGCFLVVLDAGTRWPHVRTQWRAVVPSKTRAL